MKGVRRLAEVLIVVALVCVLAAPVLAQEAEEPPAAVSWIELAQKAVMLIIQLAIPPLIAWAVSEFKRWREARAGETWYWLLENVVRDAVAAAEQLGLTEQLADFASSKLDYAIQYVERALEARGFPFDLDPYVDVIRGMIEAEVRRQFPPAGAEAPQAYQMLG